MSELKPCPMTTDEAVEILERIAHTESKWPGTEDSLTALDMAVTVLRAQPANEPLTLEQLREMDGKPVYVVPINQSDWICWENDSNAAYGLVRKSWVRVWREETADMQHTDFDFDDYRKTWLAYRRKPERSKNDGT